MPVLPIATVSSLGGVKLDPLNDIQADFGAISTKYNGPLNLDGAFTVVGLLAKGLNFCGVMGAKAETLNDQAIALGHLSKSLAICSTAGAGVHMDPKGNYSVALGLGPKASADCCVALGSVERQLVLLLEQKR